MKALARTFAASAAALALAPPAAAQPLDPISARLLAAHNAARASMGLAPLAWDPLLASSAAAYGPTLAAIGTLQHSPKQSRPGQRENLWMGTAGAFTPEQMIRTFVDERRYFRSGIYPNVSTTGNWMDVGHYTTMMWPSTTRVGCAVHRAKGIDWLICRYSPPGNIDGKPLFLPPIGERG
ncbi:SCP-like extracellular [Sphingomonas sabuli]|uniref:SCP-like extracellular n=1 Tax=Sphingomonas sabuli TaxID=2764186 RepID=A0A7G9L421_9SPHN|nr:CAP domain-containing protein [Sphingomonas sabuli]QNM83370.1 SCP-like extracellular [Sphingomonas sabuli]